MVMLIHVVRRHIHYSIHGTLFFGTFDTMYSVDKDLIFAKPVSTTIAPDYYTVIKNPMDLSTLEKRIERFEYPDFASFSRDLLLIPDNCMVYNPPQSIYHKQALKFRRQAVALIEKAETTGILVNSVDPDTGILPMELCKSMTGYAIDEPVPEFRYYTKDLMSESPVDDVAPQAPAMVDAAALKKAGTIEPPKRGKSAQKEMAIVSNQAVNVRRASNRVSETGKSTLNETIPEPLMEKTIAEPKSFKRDRRASAIVKDSKTQEKEKKTGATAKYSKPLEKKTGVIAKDSKTMEKEKKAGAASKDSKTQEKKTGATAQDSQTDKKAGRKKGGVDAKSAELKATPSKKVKTLAESKSKAEKGGRRKSAPSAGNKISSGSSRRRASGPNAFFDALPVPKQAALDESSEMAKMVKRKSGKRRRTK